MFNDVVAVAGWYFWKELQFVKVVFFSPRAGQPRRNDAGNRAEILDMTTTGSRQVFLVDRGEQIEIETVKMQSPLNKGFGEEPMLALTAEIDGIVFPVTDTGEADVTSILKPTEGADAQVIAMATSSEPPSSLVSFGKTDITMVLKQNQKQRGGVKTPIGLCAYFLGFCWGCS